MKPKKHRARGELPCVQWHADDGLPDDHTFRKSFRTHKNQPDRKLLQLCGQVRRTLSLALAGCGDASLQDLLVESVDPAPDAGRLRVTVRAAPGTVGAAADVATRLSRLGGYFRREVAAAVCRKRAPELVFHVAATGPAAGEVAS